MTRCSKCVLPETYPGISFGEDGVCNSCLNHKDFKPLGEDELLKRTNSYRNSGGKYDCIVALSGGRDSTFTAYYATKVLGLRALAYTWDNGYFPEETRKNIEKAVNILGIDHVFWKSDNVSRNIKHVLSAWIRKPSPGMIPLVCTGCRAGYGIGMYNTAKDNNINLIITGEGEPETSFASAMVSVRSDNPTKAFMMFGLACEFAKNPYYLLSPRFFKDFAVEFRHRYLRPRKIGTWIRLFNFLKWNEEQIMSVISGELGWRKPVDSNSPWRADCTIHLLKQFLYWKTVRFTKNDEILSGMIRRKLIGRQEAMSRLEHENVISEEFIRGFMDNMGLQYDKLMESLEKFNS